VSVDESGHFQLMTTGITAAASIAGVPVAGAASDFSVDANIGANGALSGSVSGLDTSLTGSRSTDTGATQSVAGFYAAGAPNSSSASYTIVGNAGEAFSLMLTATTTDGGPRQRRSLRQSVDHHLGETP
jgi:hypothetical protein